MNGFALCGSGFYTVFLQSHFGGGKQSAGGKTLRAGIKLAKTTTRTKCGIKIGLSVVCNVCGCRQHKAARVDGVAEKITGAEACAVTALATRRHRSSYINGSFGKFLLNEGQFFR